MNGVWLAILALPGLAAVEQPAITADALRQSCAALVESPPRPGSEACRHYLQGLLVGASAARPGGAGSRDDADWESRAARTRLGPRVRRPEPAPYCLPRGLSPGEMAHALLRHDVPEAKSAQDWVEAALARQYPCRTR